jgi:hypothetical protein
MAESFRDWQLREPYVDMRVNIFGRQYTYSGALTVTIHQQQIFHGNKG